MALEQNTEQLIPNMPPMLKEMLIESQGEPHLHHASSSEQYINDAYEYKHSLGEGDKNSVVKSRQMPPDIYKMFAQGSRDESLFCLANHLVKGGMPTEMIHKYMKFCAFNCQPPFSERETFQKIESALNRSRTRDRNLSQDVREWVQSSNGVFFSSDVAKDLQLSTREEKKNLSTILRRLKTDGLIEKDGKQNGQYRKVDSECEEIDFLNAPTDTFNIKLPFGLNEMVEVMPGNIILIAGEPNAGKTAFLLNIVKSNMHHLNIHYFSSEMGRSEMRKRLSKFKGIQLKDWKFKPKERTENFGDVIKPGKDSLNIIDFIELYQDFYEISGKLAEINKKLNGAVAIVAIQKNPGIDTGLGGYRTLEKPRLALSMGPGFLKIVKAKNFVGEDNPNKKRIDFKLVDGCDFTKLTDWYSAPQQ